MKSGTLCTCLCIANFLWLCFFIADMLLTDFHVHTICFYVLTFGILQYRFYGVCWCTVVVHALIPIIVLIVLIVHTCCYFITRFPNMSIIIPIIVQIIAAIPLVVYRWNRSCDYQALMTGVHAHLGLIVVIIYWWTLVYLIRRSFEACVVTIVYMLCFLAVVLTPQLYGVAKSLTKSKVGDIKSTMSIKELREPVQSRPITIQSRSQLRQVQSRASEASRQSMSLDLEIFVRRT